MIKGIQRFLHKIISKDITIGICRPHEKGSGKGTGRGEFLLDEGFRNFHYSWR